MNAIMNCDLREKFFSHDEISIRFVRKFNSTCFVYYKVLHLGDEVEFGT